jgi:hypothetical protein
MYLHAGFNGLQIHSLLGADCIHRDRTSRVLPQTPKGDFLVSIKLRCAFFTSEGFPSVGLVKVSL